MKASSRTFQFIGSSNDDIRTTSKSLHVVAGEDPVHLRPHPGGDVDRRARPLDDPDEAVPGLAGQLEKSVLRPVDVAEGRPRRAPSGGRRRSCRPSRGTRRRSTRRWPDSSSTRQAPRCRQALTNARIPPSPWRTTRARLPGRSMVTKSPAFGSWETWAASTGTRSKIRSCSSRAISGVAVDRRVDQHLAGRQVARRVVDVLEQAHGDPGVGLGVEERRHLRRSSWSLSSFRVTRSG